MHRMGMNTWIDMVEDNRICCDELALLGLSVMYQRHCLVVNQEQVLVYHCNQGTIEYH